MTKPIDSNNDSENNEPNEANVEEDANAEVEQEQPADEQQEAEDKPSDSDEEGGDELPEWAREKLTKANAEAANYRTKLREAEKKLESVKTLEEVDELIASMKAERQQEDEKSAAEKHALLIELVAQKFKLPPSLSKRLVGSTREELEKDAEELASDFAKDDVDVDLEGGLSPRNRDADAGLGPRELAAKYSPRSKR